MVGPDLVQGALCVLVVKYEIPGMQVLDVVCAHISREGASAEDGDAEESGEVDDTQAWPVLYYSTVVMTKALSGMPRLQAHVMGA